MRAALASALLVPAIAVGTSAAVPADDSLPSCEFRAGQTLETTRPELPRGSDIPIDHIVVVAQENRSFDHYFQALPDYGQKGVAVAPPATSNIDGNGKVVPFEPAETPCLGNPDHDWSSVHRQVANGEMNGFARFGGADSMRHYDARWLPYYYALADTFAIADGYHASVPGPTWPNRMYLVAASSFGHTRNEPPPPRTEERSIFHLLEEAGLDWSIYSAKRPSFEEDMFPKLHGEKGEHFLTVDDFVSAARAGELPAFSWVTSAGGHNEHPHKSIQTGEVFVSGIVEAVMRSPNWPRTALFFTYDEHGGFYDHVPPPAACPPDDIAPIIGADDVPGKFDRLGVRVPMIVVSPYAKAHFVSHETYDHSSILRFVQARFDLPALSARDANAEPPMDMFDFSRTAFIDPPTLPEPTVDPEFMSQCSDTRGGRYSDEAATGR